MIKERELMEGKGWSSTELFDGMGLPILVGDILLRADKLGSTACIIICEVTAIKNGKIHLDNSTRPIEYSSRCFNVTAWERKIRRSEV